jgi:hypothetical protein
VLKRPGRSADHPTISSAKVGNGLDLHPRHRSVPAYSCHGVTAFILLIICNYTNNNNKLFCILINKEIIECFPTFIDWYSRILHNSAEEDDDDDDKNNNDNNNNNNNNKIELPCIVWKVRLSIFWDVNAA